MIPKLKNKFVLISIISAIVVTSIALFAVPTFAAGLPWGSRGGANNNYARVQGTISSLTSEAIKITPTTTNGNTSSILDLKLTSSTNFAIHGNSWLSDSSLTGGSSLVGKTVNVTYDKTSRVAIQVMIGMPAVTPAPGAPGTNKNFASVAGSFGNVSNSGVDINITGSIPNGITLSTPSSGSNVTIIYNSSTGAIQGIMLNRSEQPATTPRAQSNRNFAFVTGTLETVSNKAVDITITAGAIPSVSALVAPSTGSNVTIIYNNTSGELQGVMVNGSGRFPFIPNSRPNINFASVQGTVSVAGTSPYTVTITPSTAPSVGLTETSGQTVTIIYNSSTGAIQGIIPNRSGQPTPMPRTPSNNNLATVQGTVSVAGNVITITPNTTPSVTLTAVSGQMVNILYNDSTGAVQGIMLPRSGQVPFTPNNQTNQNGPNWNRGRPFGQFGPFGHAGMNR